ncbi:hypothetical protein SAMN02799622_00210 [Methylobacterium sp. UNC378MF]|nr:hypothetical protein SAMN02799622_00210 [Methylobacterium sp. UNC378MF]
MQRLGCRGLRETFAWCRSARAAQPVPKEDPGAPHGLVATHAHGLDADLLAFIQG